MSHSSVHFIFPPPNPKSDPRSPPNPPPTPPLPLPYPPPLGFVIGLYWLFFEALAPLLGSFALPKLLGSFLAGGGCSVLARPPNPPLAPP